MKSADGELSNSTQGYVVYILTARAHTQVRAKRASDLVGMPFLQPSALTLVSMTTLKAQRITT